MDERTRRRSSNLYPIQNTGPIASAAWCAARELFPTEPHWHVVMTLVAGASRLRIEVFAEEWGYRFDHAGRASWIRVTDVPFVHGHDDHDLLRATPPLERLGRLVRTLETTHGLVFERANAQIDTTLAGAEPAILSWIAAL